VAHHVIPLRRERWSLSGITDIDQTYRSISICGTRPGRFTRTGKSRMPAMRKLPVVLLCRRPSGCAVGQIRSTDSAVPRSQGGRFAIVTKRGAGCDGRGGFKRRMKPWRTAKSCGPDTPTLVSSLLDDQQATVAKEPGHRGEHEISRNTIAQGVPDCFGVPVVTCSCAFFICTRGCGCGVHPAFPAPSVF
jgi:hypothetical protein